MKGLADIGLVGLSVMGENLALNMEGKGFSVALYYRGNDKVDHFMRGKGYEKKFIVCNTIEKLVNSLSTPRKIMLMITAGRSVDDFIELLIPLLSFGDIIIDGGNALYSDTTRRSRYVESKGLLYIGTGISGGEEGALLGPSIMPGGSKGAWPQVKPIFMAIAAKDDGETPCCDWIGEEGAGHFVMMVHNCIEYANMELICETYQVMKEVLGMTSDEMYEVFSEWNKGNLNSYLIEITRDILKFKDVDGSALVEKILDIAGQKGTATWPGIAAIDLEVPMTLVGEAVFARMLSFQKEERIMAFKLLRSSKPLFGGNRQQFIRDIENALYASIIVSFAQGFMLLKAAAREYGWNLNYGSIAMLWREGSIIRSAFLGKIKEAFDKDHRLNNLLFDPYFKGSIMHAEDGWRSFVTIAVQQGISIPAIAAALSFFDGLCSRRLPANLLQAQRDYFGAQTYERVDSPRGEFFHTRWSTRHS